MCTVCRKGRRGKGVSSMPRVDGKVCWAYMLKDGWGMRAHVHAIMTATSAMQACRRGAKAGTQGHEQLHQHIVCPSKLLEYNSCHPPLPQPHNRTHTLAGQSQHSYTIHNTLQSHPPTETSTYRDSCAGSRGWCPRPSRSRSCGACTAGSTCRGRCAPPAPPSDSRTPGRWG